MDFDGSFGQVQFGGDLAVGSPGGELEEDGLFPVTELAEQGIPRASRSCCRPGSGIRGTNWAMSRRIAACRRSFARGHGFQLVERLSDVLRQVWLAGLVDPAFERDLEDSDPCLGS